ncbi:MAG: TonB-dependent receptor [Muribaculum sp.]|nr:TonB-dependent receptor [Muribaculum sp.]
MANEIPSYTDLEELVVKANSPLLKSDGNKLEYNVDEDPAASGSSVLDILRKTPLITVDGQDNIKVNGKSNYKLLINGKEEPMVSQNASIIFKNMPAQAVSKIEVITDPGAKYDAEGVGGVLNIITTRQQKGNDGYNGQLSLSFGRQNNYVSAYGTLKKHNVTLSANVTYSDGHLFPQHQEKSGENKYFRDSPVAFMKTWEKNKMSYSFTYGTLSASWEPNESNLFTASASVTSIGADIKNYLTYSRSYNSMGDLLNGADQSITGDLNNVYLSANASYQHNFRPQNNFLTISYLFSFGKNHLNFLSDYERTINMYDVWKYLSSNNKNLSREHTVQGDYTNGFGTDKHLLETGVKGIFRRNGSFSYQMQGNAMENLTNVPGADQVFSQYQDIYAAYASYTGSFGIFSTRAGIRYEHTDMGMKFRVGSTPSFNRSLDNIVPNASLTYSFNSATNLRLAYNMKITRPNIEQVNPFETTLRGQNIRKGNPNLSSEKNNTVSFTFSKFGRLLGGNIGIEYSNTNNAISEFTYLKDGYVVTTSDNIGSEQELALTGFLNWNILSGMTANVSGRLNYNILKAPGLSLKKYGWGGDINASWTYRFNDNTLSAFGGWSARDINIQRYNSGWHYYGLSAGRDFLKNKSLNITLSAMNMFEDRISFLIVSTTKDVDFRQQIKMPVWNVGLTISWKFGNNQAQVKQTENQIVNDDNASSGSGKSKGGQGGISL